VGCDHECGRLNETRLIGANVEVGRGPAGVKCRERIRPRPRARIGLFALCALIHANPGAGDIRFQVEQIYATNRFWPEPLISINPHFEQGASVEQLAREGSLHPDTARVFRVDGQPIRFHRHQAQAIAKAAQGKSFAVTTGTGSGKSLCFFVPIIDAAIRARTAGEPARTRAIVIYPMNALANSQMKELEKFIEQSGLPQNLLPTFARYTGQESQEERERIQQAKSDIILTNFC
jgi:ATP-dependent helicase YprA (DUF1998 family)